MSDIATNLQKIKTATAAIKQSIINKGVTIGSSIDTWSSAIDSIETSSSIIDFIITRISSSNPNIVLRADEKTTWEDFIESKYNFVDLQLGTVAGYQDTDYYVYLGSNPIKDGYDNYVAGTQVISSSTYRESTT